jgi:hypothetical protein
MTVQIKLDTADFTIFRRPDGRIGAYISGATEDVELDLAPDVAQDLMVQLVDPDPED